MDMSNVKVMDSSFLVKTSTTSRGTIPEQKEKGNKKKKEKKSTK